MDGRIAKWYDKMGLKKEHLALNIRSWILWKITRDKLLIDGFGHMAQLLRFRIWHCFCACWGSLWMHPCKWMFQFLPFRYYRNLWYRIIMLVRLVGYLIRRNKCFLMWGIFDIMWPIRISPATCRQVLGVAVLCLWFLLMTLIFF